MWDEGICISPSFPPVHSFIILEAVTTNYTVVLRSIMLWTRVLRAALNPLHDYEVVSGEAKKQMRRWTTISVAMLGLTGAVGAFQLFEDHDPHRHHDEPHEDPPHYSYLKIRNKPYPWHYSNCDLLDFHCKQLARAAEKALMTKRE